MYDFMNWVIPCQINQFSKNIPGDHLRIKKKIIKFNIT